MALIAFSVLSSTTTENTFMRWTCLAFVASAFSGVAGADSCSHTLSVDLSELPDAIATKLGTAQLEELATRLVSNGNKGGTVTAIPHVHQADNGTHTLVAVAAISSIGHVAIRLRPLLRAATVDLLLESAPDMATPDVIREGRAAVLAAFGATDAPYTVAAWTANTRGACRTLNDREARRCICRTRTTCNIACHAICHTDTNIMA